MTMILSMGDPVFHMRADKIKCGERIKPGWYFLDEARAICHGPFATESECRAKWAEHAKCRNKRE